MSSDLEKGFHQKIISFWPNSVWFTHQYNSWCCWCACCCHTCETGNDTCEATNETSRHKSTSELLICHWPLYRPLTAGCISGCFFQSLLPGVANYFKLCFVGSVCSARLPVWSGSITCNFIITKIHLHWGWQHSSNDDVTILAYTFHTIKTRLPVSEHTFLC